MKSKDIEEGIVSLIKKAETELPNDVIDALKRASTNEEGMAKVQIETILKNVELAKSSGRPMCQDTGIQTFFVSVGIDSPFISWGFPMTTASATFSWLTKADSIS